MTINLSSSQLDLFVKTADLNLIDSLITIVKSTGRFMFSRHTLVPQMPIIIADKLLTSRLQRSSALPYPVKSVL